MPSQIKTYDRSEDSKDHLKIFQAAAKTERWAMPTWCHMFNSTLTGNARVWFDDLPAESIESYDDLKKAFLENYLQQKKDQNLLSAIAWKTFFVVLIPGWHVSPCDSYFDHCCELASPHSLCLGSDTTVGQVTAIEKLIRRLSLVELEIATNQFDNRSIIGYGNMGIMYKAVFPDRVLLAVKMLHEFDSFEREYFIEINILGRLQQTNLIPLLGFCYAREKKFLVYKYMNNGSLHQWLHCKSQVDAKKMG
ncbi:probably inactive leucine-rich repeat receptor-like protein kinase [Tanacetum coccineum]